MLPIWVVSHYSMHSWADCLLCKEIRLSICLFKPRRPIGGCVTGDLEHHEVGFREVIRQLSASRAAMVRRLRMPHLWPLLRRDWDAGTLLRAIEAQPDQAESGRRASAFVYPIGQH